MNTFYMCLIHLESITTLFKHQWFSSYIALKPDHDTCSGLAPNSFKQCHTWVSKLFKLCYAVLSVDIIDSMNGVPCPIISVAFASTSVLF